MKRLLLVVAVLTAIMLALLGSLAQETATEPQPTATDFLLGGIQVNEPDHHQWVSALQAAGMNTVSVTVYARQGDWDSDNLWFDEEDKWVVHEMRAAKAQGLHVVLILRVALDHAYERNRFLWHGMIMPKDAASIDSWFGKYEAFVSKWAAIAQLEGVDVFSIGSEMNALAATQPIIAIPPLEEWYLNQEKQSKFRERTMRFAGKIEEKHLWVRGTDNFQQLDQYLRAKAGTHEQWAKKVSFDGDAEAVQKMNVRRQQLQGRWLQLISKVRSQYTGKLTYAANFDNYREVGFWNQLDNVGINAYFALRQWPVVIDNSNGLHEMTERWEDILDELNDFRVASGLQHKQVLFTELGYTFRKYSTLEPWGGFGFSVVGEDDEETLMVWQEQEIDLEERANAVRALYRAHEEVSPGMLSGILYWKLTTNVWHEDIEPFALTIGRAQRDPLQDALAAFAK